MTSAIRGTSQRTFQHAVCHLLETEYGFIKSRRIIQMLADDMEQLADQFRPPASIVKPGWMVLTGTKATGRKAIPGRSAGEYPLMTLAWPVLLPEDLQAMMNKPHGHAASRTYMKQLLKQRLQRILEYGYAHPDGPVLLTATDLGLMLGRDDTSICRLLAELRQETGKPLLTKGYYFDQGVRPSHKVEIIALYEQGMDEVDIARHSQHAQTSVGRYIRDYERVKLLLQHQIDSAEIAPLSGLQPSVVDAYIALLRQYHPSLVPDSKAAPNGA